MPEEKEEKNKKDSWESISIKVLIIANILLVIANFSLAYSTSGQLKIANEQFKLTNRPFLSIVSFAPDFSGYPAVFLYLGDSGNLPAKYNVTKVIFTDYAGNEYSNKIDYPVSIIYPKDTDRGIRTEIPSSLLASVNQTGKVNITIGIDYWSITDTNQQIRYYYEENMLVYLNHASFFTNYVNAN